MKNIYANMQNVHLQHIKHDIYNVHVGLRSYMRGYMYGKVGRYMSEIGRTSENRTIGLVPGPSGIVRFHGIIHRVCSW